MKKFAAVILCCALLATSLSGCGFVRSVFKKQQADATAPATEATEVATEPSQAPETTVPTESTTPLESTAPTETTAPATEPVETVAPAGNLPYTVFLPYECPVFEKAGYNSRYAQAVGEDGIFTIVEETVVENALWGKLKSGIGWVDLTKAKETSAMTAGFAEGKILELDSRKFSMESSQSATKLVFRAYEQLTDVRLTSLHYSGSTYVVSETLYILPQMSPEKPLVADLVFYGDMTAYGISFVDANGATHCFAATVSGRNGMLVFTEYAP